MRELETSAEFNSQKPFVIRGHHLPIFKYLIQPNRLSPNECAKNLRSAVEMFPTKVLESSIFFSPYYQQESIRNSKEYVHDVLGTSPEIANTYEEYSRRIFEIFLSLPDDHPAEIVEGTPDVICKGCAFGNHCRKIYSPDGTNMLKDDGKALDEFIRATSDLYLPKPTIVRKKVFFFDAKQKKVRIVKTTMSRIKKVLAKPNYFL